MSGRRQLETLPLTECTDALADPDRGFYAIHRFLLDEQPDCAALAREGGVWNGDAELCLVEINLRQYRACPIPERALESLSAFLSAVKSWDRRLIVRFLYDWDGRNMQLEPASRELIQLHMHQVAPVLSEQREQLFLLQGLFIGNWGEMNGTRYGGSKDLAALAAAMNRAAPEGVFLAVRTPAQLRVCRRADSGPMQRMGLFNDGMTGSITDLGTFSQELQARAAEQDAVASLSRAVPYGGEAVCPCPLNDYPQALAYFRQYRVSYLNRDYDPRVLKKWRAASCTEPGPWNGTDGLTYIRRHLGYRFRAVSCKARLGRGSVSARLVLTNDGFAPAYRPLRAELLLRAPDGRALCSAALSGGDLRSLTGAEGKSALKLQGRLPLDASFPDALTLCLRLRQEGSSRPIRLANREADEQGEIILGRLRSP